jgi:hypothetical protein
MLTFDNIDEDKTIPLARVIKLDDDNNEIKVKKPKILYYYDDFIRGGSKKTIEKTKSDNIINTDVDDDDDDEEKKEKKINKLYKIIPLNKKKGELSKMKNSDRERLIYYLKNNIEPYEEMYKPKFNYVKSMLDKDENEKKKHIELEADEKFAHIPDILTRGPTGRNTYLISGVSGSGKSTFTSYICKEYHRLYPDNNIYLFSRKDKDEVLDKLPYITRVLISIKLLDNPIDFKKLAPCLTIFDDTDTIDDKELNDYIQGLNNDILECGRDINGNAIWNIKTCHQLFDYKRSRIQILEALYIVVFPSIGWANIKRLLCEKLGVDSQTFKKIQKIKSRWFLISKTNPLYLLTEYECILLQ